MRNTMNEGDQDLCADELSLAPTEDLGTPIEDIDHDAQYPVHPPSARRRGANDELLDVLSSSDDDEDVNEGVQEMLRKQKEWQVTPVGRPIPASATLFSNDPNASHLTFYQSMSVLRDTSDPEYDEDGNARVTHSVGDTVLIEWQRKDPKENQSGVDQAVCRILAIFMDNRDGIARFAPQWGRSWSDILNPYSDQDTVEPDDALRGSKEIFWEAETGIWPDIECNPLVERGLCADELNEVYNITRKCIVRHRDEFETEEDLEEYLEHADTYFYRYSLPYAGPIRFEEIMCPTTSSNIDSTKYGSGLPKKKWLSGPLRMVDAFCGSGAVSVAATEVGWTVTFGIESDLRAFETFARNAPHAAKSRNYRIQDFSTLVKAGTDPKIPKKGQVDYLHLSPPCQSLCSQNAHKGMDRYIQDLLPILECIRELILELEPAFITIEEVARFVYTVLPKHQFTKRKKAVEAEAAAAAAAAAVGNGDNDPDVERDDGDSTEAVLPSNLKECVPVRSMAPISTYFANL